MDEGQAAFRAGRAGHDDRRHVPPRLRSARIKGFEWGVAELPANADGMRSNYRELLGQRHHAPRRQGEKLEAAEKFLAYVTSPEAMKIWLEMVGELPARRDGGADATRTSSNPIYGAVPQGARILPHDALRRRAGPAPGRDRHGQPRRCSRTRTPKASLAEAAKAEQAILDRAQAAEQSAASATVRESRIGRPPPAGALDRAELRQKQVVWAWAIPRGADPVLRVIRFYPTLQAFYLSFTDWNIVGRRRSSASPTTGGSVARPAVLEGVPQHLPLSGRRHADQPAAVLRRRVLPRPRALHARAHPRALLPAVPDHGGGHGLGLALVLPAGADRRVQRSAGRARHCRSSRSCAPPTQALPAVLAPAIWAGLGFQIVIFLAGLRAIPQRPITRRRAIDGAGAMARSCARSRCRCCKPTIVFLVVFSLDRLPAHLRPRLQHEHERSRRAARRDQAAGADDLPDGVRPSRWATRRPRPSCCSLILLAISLAAAAHPEGPLMAPRPCRSPRRAVRPGGSSPGRCCFSAASSW